VATAKVRQHEPEMGENSQKQIVFTVPHFLLAKAALSLNDNEELDSAQFT
jgi:hypothetical protein